jgi:5S rRNA maturation endonuclease (ribonuclease M5)
MEERAELLIEFLSSIDAPVFVEGVKDREALEALGVKDVVQLNRGGSILSAVEALQGRKSAVILTDLDQEGKILRKKLIEYFSLYGITESRRPREILAQMKFSHVEGLRTMIQDEEVPTTLK